MGYRKETLVWNKLIKLFLLNEGIKKLFNVKEKI